MTGVSKLLLAVAVIPTVLLAAPGAAWADVAYLRSEAGGPPWGTADNEQAMDMVFGAGGWQDLRFETVDPAVLFSPTYTFLYLEGSDGGAIDLQTFLGANQGLLESWVAAGGRLFLNAAPNEGGDMAWGFTGVTLVNSAPLDPAMPADDTHPIWNGPFLPINTTVSGGGYAHAHVTGFGLTPLIVDANGLTPLTELAQYGTGHVIFGGLTNSSFWVMPQDGLDLRANILWYVGQDDADVDGIADSADNCVDAANYEQEDGDGDDLGDACDPCGVDPDNDVDGDIVCGDVDNCPDVLNFNQADVDADTVGDACDVCPGDAEDDADTDGVCGDVDNCPDDANDDQADADDDGIGDACEQGGSSSGDSGDPVDPDSSGSDGATSDPTADSSGSDGGITGIDSASAGTDDGTAGASGDDSGCGCAASPSSGSTFWLVAIAGVALRRRRRARALAGFTCTGVLGCYSPEDAQPVAETATSLTTAESSSSGAPADTSSEGGSMTTDGPTTGSVDTTTTDATTTDATTTDASSSSSGGVPGVCGDGNLDADTEACDDGNLDPGDLCDASCAFESLTFGYVGAIETLEIPAWVDTLRIEAWGAQGGGARCCDEVVQDDGGLGGYAAGTFPTLAGVTLGISVGGQGISEGLGGFNGGGAGGEWGAGGGGASDVRIGADLFGRILVAGGGGGGNCGCPDQGVGGGGGGLDGEPGTSDSFPVGGGGGQGAGGAPGQNCTPGTAGQGGTGDGDSYHVGGGGGGWYGGGGGYAAGGGGGSSYYGVGEAAETTPAVRVGNGEIVITPVAAK